ncbi:MULTISPECIES: hypothetical protein [Moorena]|nr:hypothetical protein [Moorena sp. SIO4G3]NEO77433.1 hypothetical protein [Moorena sp. SIO4G3]
MTVESLSYTQLSHYSGSQIAEIHGIFCLFRIPDSRFPIPDSRLPFLTD